MVRTIKHQLRRTSAFCLLPSDFLLLLLVLLAYTPIWHAGFLWDDNVMLTANPCIVGPLGLKEIWTTNAADICPLTTTTLWFEHALWGLAPLQYHFVNILIHGACAAVLWRVLRRLRVQGAWLGASLWALHPVQVESVAWITEMKNTESGLFFLLSILFFVKYLTPISHDPPNNARRAGWNYGFSVLFAALAMATKSSTVVLPVVLCLCAWWIERRWNWRNLARVMPMLLMSVAASALSIWTQTLQPGIQTDPQWVRPWPQRLATAGDAVWFYLGKLLWPDPLITVYPRWQIDVGQWESYSPVAAVILFFLLLWLMWRSALGGSRACFFAFAYFIVALLPVLGLIDPFISRYSLVFDHFQYLASIGPLALAGAGLARAWDLLSNSNADTILSLASKNRWLRPALCAGLLLVLGFVTWQRTWAYQSEEILWRDTVAKNPDCWLGHYNVGNACIQKGQIDDAIVQYQKSLEINPNYAEAHNNLGNALFRKGKLNASIAEYQKTLEINPNLAETRTNLGHALLQKGQLDAAIEQYQEAVKSGPNYALAHANFGVALLQKGRVDQAITEFEEALRLNPNLGPVRDLLAKAMERQKAKGKRQNEE